ncbi:MAG: DUF983 domain-containing protein [Thermoflexibacter sp.]|nr:DUF983 domain-containing protein [Thermoflexibacter sp.]
MKTINHKPSTFLSIANCQCPRCRQGNIFTHSTFNLAQFTKMNERCPSCNFKFEIEPGFFVGAMYIGYAMSIAVFTTVCVAIVILSNFFGFATSVMMYVSSIIIATIVMIPINFRYSRVLMIYWFGGEQAKYNPELASQNK